MKDPAIEKALIEIEEKLTAAWKNNRCLTCPIGELAALAAATRLFYQLNTGGPQPPLAPVKVALPIINPHIESAP